VVAVVVPIEEYRQLRQAMQEQQVNEAGFPSNRGDFLITVSCNFASSSYYRTPVHFVSLAPAGARV